MAYGIQIKNNSGNVIISNDYPTYVKRTDISDSNDRTSGSYYMFDIDGNLAASGGRILMLKPNVGQWIAFEAPIDDGSGSVKRGISSNENTINGAVLDDPANLANPSFGVLIRSSSGVTTWQSDKATAYVVDGELKKFVSYDDTYTRTFTGVNCGCFSGGGFEAFFNDNETNGFVMERTATSTIRFSNREVYPGLGVGGGGSGSVTYVSDLFMMVGRIT